MKWFLLTGQPSTGKTTIVNKTIDALRRELPEVKLNGFITDEVIKSGKRHGFQVVTVSDGKGVPFASKSGKGKFKTGAYYVDPEALDRSGVASLTKDETTDLYVVDEIGRMEMHSKKFQERIKVMLGDENCACIGTVAAPRYGHVVPLAEEVKSMDRVEVFHVKKSTRDKVLLEFKDAVLSYWRCVLEDRKTKRQKRSKN